MTNFTIAHEAFHAGLHAWPGYPDYGTAPNLSFNIATVGDQIHLTLNGYGKVAYELPAPRNDEHLTLRVAEVVESSIRIRRSGNAAAALKLLSNLNYELNVNEDTSVVLKIQVDNALAGAIRDTGNSVEAIALYRRCLDIAQRRLGTGSRLALVLEDNLAEALLTNGDISGALAARAWVAQASKLFFGDLDYDTLKAEYNLASTQLQSGDAWTAYQICSRLVKSAKGKLMDREYFAAVDLLGSAMIAIGKAGEACKVRVELYQQCVTELGLRDPTTRIVRHNLYAAFIKDAREKRGLLTKASRMISLLVVLLSVLCREVKKRLSLRCSLRSQSSGDRQLA